MSDRGYASTTALFLLFFFSLMGIGLSVLAGQGFLLEKREADKDASLVLLSRKAEEILEALAKDESPGESSLRDAVWQQAEAVKGEGYEVVLEDVSSRINPNWVRKNLFEKTGLDRLFKEGKTAGDLQQHREDHGFFSDLQEGYGDFFGEKGLERFFTPYGYANINMTDEFSLRKLYTLRTGRPGEPFRGRIQELLREKKILAAEELKNFLGADHESLYPVICTEAMMNVHFLDPYLLEEILSYPDYEIENGREKALLLVGIRDGRELKQEELPALLGTEKTNRVFEYLGVVTWFWGLRIARERGELRLVVARLPSEKNEAPEYRIIERGFFVR
jgi:hypothetical protein